MSESSAAWNAQRLDASTTPAVIASSSLPASPSRDGLSRRLSWNRPSLEHPRMSEHQPSTSHTYPPLSRSEDYGNPFEEDDEEEREHAQHSAYNLQQPSQTSLVADFHHTSEAADDEQRLTSSAQPFWGAGGIGGHDEDEERRAGNAIKGRRQRYVGSPTRSGTLGGSALRAVQRNLRRVSIRVVDLASSSSTRDQGVKLEDQEDEKTTPVSEEPLPATLPTKLRGKSLGLFDQHSPLRNLMYNIMLSP